ncbi:MAB_1171c family putative transporter [Nocardia sp. KC 131]|uniref:MAB_1171c family putative transporter n=1 Tax=Nocardia arseniciresistens TaxID=3392119 RepID=UPI00398E5F56
MTSPLPAYIALPVIVITLILTVGRWMLLNQTSTDRLINRSLAWAVLGLMLHERGVAPDVASLAHQLSLGCILFILAGIYGIAQLWGGGDPATVRQRQRHNDAAATIVFAAVLASGTPARRQGLLIDQALGWPAIVFWAVFGAPLAVCAVSILRISVREFRAEDLGLREKLVYCAIFAAAGGLLLDAIAGPSVAALSTYTGISLPDPQMRRKAATFFAATLAAAIITAIPLFGQLTSRMGWDRTARYSRQLQPLWRDLTAAFPGLVLYPADKLIELEPAARLHRMTVEIRDSLLNLRPYMSATNQADAVAAGDGDVQMVEYAIRLAQALKSKHTGALPNPVAAKSAPRAPSAAGDLDSELRSLLELARHWPHAQAAIVAARPQVRLRQHATNKEQTR